MMRGPRGTKILIQVLRTGWTQPKPFVIKRASIRVSSVTLHMLDKDIPYVRLSQFQERTAPDLEEALAKAHKKAGGNFRGLVLDLRDNPGGLLDQAVKVGDIWIDDGMIVFSEGRNGGNRMEWHAKKEGTEPEYPMIVLVNGGSASASEIVSGSLQDHKRALVLGTQTFGKGSVQTIIPLEDGSGLRLTTALYYLPSGRSIQEVRVQPDVLVEPYSEAELAAQKETKEVRHPMGEVDLEGHFGSQQKPKPEASPSRRPRPSRPRSRTLPQAAGSEAAKEARFEKQVDATASCLARVELLEELDGVLEAAQRGRRLAKPGESRCATLPGCRSTTSAPRTGRVAGPRLAAPSGADVRHSCSRAWCCAQSDLLAVGRVGPGPAREAFTAAWNSINLVLDPRRLLRLERRPRGVPDRHVFIFMMSRATRSRV